MKQKIYKLILYALLTYLVFFAEHAEPAQSKTVSGGRELKSRYEELLREIKRHDRLYYEEHRPVISDTEYDTLMRQLLYIEEEHPEWVLPSSPSQSIGSSFSANRPSSHHLTSMLSINSIQSRAELALFLRRIMNEPGPRSDYAVEEKIDGVAISLQYRNRRLESALTRGNGMVGNDVTAHIRRIPGIPAVLKAGTPDLVEIRGEIYIPKENFESLNSVGGKRYSNLRNAAAGILNTKHPSGRKLRLMRMIPHSIGRGQEAIADTQAELLSRFELLGFKNKLNQTICSSLEEIEAAIWAMERRKENLPYEIDGAVIKVNDLASSKKLGETSKAPRGMAAFKFNSKTGWTRIQNILYQKGPKGKITPVAVLEPLWLDGSFIKRVSLHNLRVLDRLDARSGDEVLIEKRGKIIPKVILVKPAKNRPQKPGLELCPFCGRKLESYLYCDFPDCSKTLTADSS